MSEADMEDLVASIARTFETDVKRLEARIDVLEAKTRQLEARIAVLEGAQRGTARSRQFVESFRDLVPAGDVLRGHSTDTDSDGVVTTLYDLVGGRTGIRSNRPGEPPGPVRFAD